MLIDSHCHLTDERLVPFAEEIVSSMAEGGLEGVKTVGYDRGSSLGGVAVARAHEGVSCTLGGHPDAADKGEEGNTAG